ncbi:hypothetical protein [Lysobacter gummosus]|uniref:hypothetical protein n=1 Tax=Lysobacter gummosus TaxID=262324 RepID=UPI00364318EB
MKSPCWARRCGTTAMGATAIVSAVVTRRAVARTPLLSSSRWTCRPPRLPSR